MFETNKKVKQITILGGGFGGVETALHLAKLRKHDRIVLVSHQDYLLYHPGLYEVATSARIDAEALVLKQTVALPLSEILGRYNNISFKQAWVENIDIDRKFLRTDDGDISFDYLVVALGSETYFDTIPGLREHAFTLKSFEDAIKIRNHVRDALTKYLETNDRSYLNFVIGGGGFTGVEFSCELAGLLRQLVNRFAGQVPAVGLWVVESGPALVPGLSPKLSKALARRLDYLNINVKLNSRITSIDKNQAVINGSEPIPTYNVFWMGGVKSTAVPCLKKIPTDKKDRVVVSSRLNLDAYPEVFVIGDCSAWLDPGTNRPLPQTAHVATEQGRFIARSIVKSILGKTLPIFRPDKNSPYVIPAGGKHAFFFYNGHVVEGFWAYVLRRIVDLKYFLSVLPWWKAIAYWWKGSVIYLKND